MSQKTYQDTVIPLKEKLFRLAFSILQHPEEAADVVQEILIKAWKNWEQWQKLDNPGAWCYKLTRNLSIDKKRSRHFKSGQEAIPEDLRVAEPNPYQLAENRDTIIYIKELMAALPEQQRLVMHLRDIEELAYQEIAEMLDISLAQVKTSLFRARKSIQKKLTESRLYETGRN